MATVTRTLGPADHGRPLTWDDFESAQWDEGYRYELVRGRLHVSPVPDEPHDAVWRWVFGRVDAFASNNPDLLNCVTPNARVFIPGQARRTSIQPDLAAYRNYPHHLPARQRSWQIVSPLLVGEILSADDADKDLVRNVELLLAVPSVREYWIFDPREDPDRPTMLVYRRRGARWQRPIEIAFGETYTTRLLPGFSLLIDPRS